MDDIIYEYIIYMIPNAPELLIQFTIIDLNFTFLKYLIF